MWLQKAFDFIVHIVCFVYRDVYTTMHHCIVSTIQKNQTAYILFMWSKLMEYKHDFSLLKIEIFCSFPPFLIKKWRFTTLSRWTKMENFGCKCLVVNPAQIFKISCDPWGLRSPVACPPHIFQQDFTNKHFYPQKTQIFIFWSRIVIF